ncbi:MAG: hypothetical protein Q7K71_04130 [Candidatus Omnitrophota bacterium]|nr:hypothetical protein [Candidatus Omnitrophota bacterium]
MFRKMKTKGQSTVEYILLATAVIGAMIFFTTGPNSALTGRLGNTLNSTADSIGSISNRLVNSQGATANGVTPAPGVTVDPTAGF